MSAATCRLRSFKHVHQPRRYHNPSFIVNDLSLLQDISSPHWRSEALVPIYNASTRSIKSFFHAKNRNERSPLGSQFLKHNSKALVHAANATLGICSDLKPGWLLSAATNRDTAFEVGQGRNVSPPQYNR